MGDLGDLGDKGDKDDLGELGDRGQDREHYGLQRNSLYPAASFAEFEAILGFSVPSIILATS